MAVRPTNFETATDQLRSIRTWSSDRVWPCCMSLRKSTRSYTQSISRNFFFKKKKRKNCVLYANFQWEFLQKFEKTIFNEKYYLVERTFAKWRAACPNLNIIGRRTEVGRWRIKVGRSNRHRPTFLALNPIEN